LPVPAVFEKVGGPTRYLFHNLMQKGRDRRVVCRNGPLPILIAREIRFVKIWPFRPQPERRKTADFPSGDRLAKLRPMSNANFPQLDVIAVGAHPDDVEIACGGTLATLVEAGYKVGIIDLTDGEPTPLSPGPDVRMAEAKAAGEALGIHLRTLLHLPNRRLFDSFEARVKLAIEFRKHKPRLVIGLGDKTPMASPDHWQAMQITDAAVFYSRLTKWDDQFENWPPHIIGRQLYCMLGQPLAGSPNPGGQIVVDISKALPRKLAAIRCYKTQFPPEKEHLFDRVDAADRYLGRSAGVVAAELLISPRPVVMKDLMRSLFE
jgi:N-acetylglucosamine malate deacetylase 1